MDPAEEVLLDPVLVNPVLLPAGKESYSCANRTVASIWVGPPSDGELNAYE